MQVVNFYSNKLTPEPHRLVLGLNAHLPNDIRVKTVARVPPDFNARYSALSKVATPERVRCHVLCLAPCALYQEIVQFAEWFMLQRH